MSALSTAELTTTLRSAVGPCVSIHMPTHRHGPDTLQDPIRLENLSKDALRQLDELGHERRSSERILAPVRALVADRSQWPARGAGLAILAWPGDSRIFHVDEPLPELCVVGPRPHTLPLLPSLADRCPFGVLALSQNAVRWFDGTRDGLTERTLDGMPRDLLSVVGSDFAQRIRNLRTAGQGGGDSRGRNAVFSGHGSGPDESRPELEKFARAVDDALVGALRTDPRPIVLAAADPLASLYRRISRLAQLVPQGVGGNFEIDDGRALFDRAWQIVAPQFDGAREALADRIRVGLGTGKVVQRIDEVVHAARDGRIEAMFAATDAHRWASAESGAIPHTDRCTGDVDLIDVAAAECLLHGGAVHPVPAHSIPGDHPVVAAVLRY